jgi:DNA-binding MarR family transcriptional regulator
MTHAANIHAIVEKWGEAGKAGFQRVPDALFKYQAALQLNPTELVVLLNICMHWWYRERLPRLRSSTIARRMNVDARTVQRALKQLQQ